MKVIKDSLKSMLSCGHPIHRRVHLVAFSGQAIQWCADCGAMRILAGGVEPPWGFCAGMETVRSIFINMALDKVDDGSG